MLYELFAGKCGGGRRECEYELDQPVFDALYLDM